MKESLACTHQLLCLDEEITSSLESVSQDITLTPGGKQLQVADSEFLSQRKSSQVARI